MNKYIYLLRYNKSILYISLIKSLSRDFYTFINIYLLFRNICCLVLGDVVLLASVARYPIWFIIFSSMVCKYMVFLPVCSYRLYSPVWSLTVLFLMKYSLGVITQIYFLSAPVLCWCLCADKWCSSCVCDFSYIFGLSSISGLGVFIFTIYIDIFLSIYVCDFMVFLGAVPHPVYGELCSSI